MLFDLTRWSSHNVDRTDDGTTTAGAKVPKHSHDGKNRELTANDPQAVWNSSTAGIRRHQRREGIAPSDDGLRILYERIAMWSLLAVIVAVTLIVFGAERIAGATGFQATHDDRGPEVADEPGEPEPPICQAGTPIAPVAHDPPDA